jgi:myo-inositol 2-dehydrogenase/D-chiro-inositol 1-dehydrogenase
MAMLKLVVVGAGNHSRENHLASLARYVAQHPGQVELAGLCDLRRDHAQEVAAQYGFARVYVDLDEMLRVEHPDACVAVTPIPVTAQIAVRVIEAGVPLLMEKPPGATVDEAQQIVQLVERTGARVMVSMNRRYDPALCAALRWWDERPIQYVRATIARVDRREPDFVYGTAIHPLDTMREIAGDVHSWHADVREVEGARWFVVRLAFEGGAAGVLEVLPTAGCMVESYDIYGAGCRALVRVGGSDTGEVRCWQGGKLDLDKEPARGEPTCVRNGAYGETVRFIATLLNGGVMYPSPAQVLQSVDLCERIQRQAPMGQLSLSV